MNKSIPINEIMRVYNRMNENKAVLFPGLDSVISLGDISDEGRYIRCELNWNFDTAKKAAEEFEHLITCLSEIGRWHLNAGGEQKWSGFDQDTFKDPETFKVWVKYFKGSPNDEAFPTSPVKYFPMNDQGGYKFDMFEYMCFLYTQIYVKGASNNVVMRQARENLANAYIINRYSKKVELIDFNKPQSKEKTIFPKRTTITEEDGKLLEKYLMDKIFSRM